jgi:TRAP-type uncharacterized transport system substrate-binding protein
MRSRTGLFAIPIAATLSLLPAPPPGAATSERTGPGIVLSAGREGGGYWGVGERLRKVAAEAGLSVDLKSSAGSTENLERLNNPGSPVNLIFTQTDALKSYLQTHPRFSGKFEILNSIGLECVFIIAARHSGIENDQDLQDPKGHRIAIPGAASGVAVTFSYMSQLVPGLANTQPEYTDTFDAMKEFGNPGAVDAIMLVHRPDANSPELKLAASDGEKYRLIPVEDRHLADKLPNGDEVYEFLDVPLTRSASGADVTVPTICTRGLLVASPKKLSPKARDALKRIVDSQWARIDREKR